MTCVIDTNAYSAFKSGNSAVTRILEEAERIVVPVIVVAELLAGFMQGNRFARNAAELEEFINQPGVTVHVIGINEANHYASLIKALRSVGTPIPANDVWIASVALAEDGRLLTRDSHFGKIPGIIPISW